MASTKRHGRPAKDPVLISSDESDDASSMSDTDSDFDAKLSNRACDREEAETALERAVEKAKSSLANFRKQAAEEADLDRIALALKKRQKKIDKKGEAARKAIKGEAVDEPTVCDKSDKLTRDQLFVQASTKLAKRVLEVMVADGIVDGAVLDALDENDPPPPHRAVNHEEELLFACIPEQLRTEGFASVDTSFPLFEPPNMGEAEDQNDQQRLFGEAIKKMFEAMGALNDKLEHLVKVQQIHTLAHLANIRATGLLRVLCLKDGARRDKVHTNLLISMKSIVLGSDPELKDLPFRTVSKTEAFFLDINHIIKLGHFLFVFVEYDRFYVSRLLDTIFSIHLQRDIYWKSGTANNGCVSDLLSSNLSLLNPICIFPHIFPFRVLPPGAVRLPRYIETFIQGVAKAAHDFANVNTGSVFNLSKFNKDCRKLLYNTERNEQRRKATENKPVSVPLVPSAAKTATPAREDSTLPDDADEFFNFKRSAKPPATEASPKPELLKKEDDQGKASGEGTESEAGNDSSTKCNEKKRKANSPGNQPPSKRSLQRACVMDHLKSVVEDGMNVDDIINLLRSYAKALGHRKGYILACKDVKLFVRELQDNDGEDDIMEIASNYSAALTKLPAILE